MRVNVRVTFAVWSSPNVNVACAPARPDRASVAGDSGKTRGLIELCAAAMN